jgi:hypothetical protein
LKYFEQAKTTCPLCQSPIVEHPDDDAAHRCTDPTCGVAWRYVDIDMSEEGLPRVKCIALTDGKQTLRIGQEDGRPVEASLTLEPPPRKPFQKKPRPRTTPVQVNSSIWTDLDKGLREAFSLWRMRNIT